MVAQSVRMREYETIYVLKPELDDKSAREFMLKIKELIERKGGKNIKVDCWGRRKLAWPKDKHERGIYVHHAYLGDNRLVAELERLLGIDESVLLRQTKVLAKDVDPESRAQEDDNLEIIVVRERREMPRQNSYGDRSFDNRGDRNFRENSDRERSERL